MFDHFLYFIVVLLIYSTYQPPDVPRLSPETAIFGSIISAFFFWKIVLRLMNRVLHEMPAGSLSQRDRRLDAASRQLSILAIILFVINLYGFELPVYLRKLSLFSMIPSFEAVVLLGLFAGYLSLVWAKEYEVQQQIHNRGVTKREYVLSNISFALPVVLPWLVLSATVDIIGLLPFEAPKKFLASSEGESIFFIFFLFFITLLGPVFIRKIWRCKPLEAGYWRDRIEALSDRAGIAFADIVYWPVFGGRMITAGVMGLVGKFRYLLVTDALFDYLTPEEIDTVVAHEIGHVKQRHMYFYLLFFGGYLLFYYSVFEILLSFFFVTKPFQWMIRFFGISAVTAASVVVTILAIFVFVFYFRYIFGFFMRNFERQADAYVLSLFDSTEPLISTFKKIAFGSGQSPEKPSWHHFSISERIDFLEKCELDRSHVDRHNQKVKIGIIGFLVALVCVGVMGYQLNFGGVGQRLSSHFLEKMVVGQLKENGPNPELYRILADIYLERKAYGDAVKYYNLSLSGDSSDPNTLNNLAWLYATAEDPAFRRPEKALSLATQAARIDSAPHILDTLAECYFLNKKFDEAYETARMALKRATENTSYYQRQLEKFEKASRIHGGSDRIKI